MTTWLLQGQVAQGYLFTDTIAFQYASKACCLKETKADDEEGLVKFPEEFWKETSWTMSKKALLELTRIKEKDEWNPSSIALCDDPTCRTFANKV